MLGQNFRNVKFDLITIPPFEKTDHGGKSTKPTYNNTGKELILQLPIMRIPYPFKGFKSKDSDRVSYGVNGSFDKSSPILNEFFGWCESFDEFLIEYVHKNCKAIMGKEMPIDGVRALYNSLIRYPEDEEKAAKYGATFKTMVRPKKDAKGFWTKCYDVNGQEMNIEDLPGGCMARMVVRFSSIYVIANKFGATWDLDRIDITQNSFRPNVQVDVNMYGEEPTRPADVYDEHMEEAIRQAEAEAISNKKKREREEEEEKEEEAVPVEETAKKPASKKANTKKTK